MAKKRNINRAENRKRQHEHKRKNQIKIFAGVIVIALICVGVFYVILSNNGSTDDTVTKTIITNDDVIQIPLGDISTEADFYTYESDGVDIDFFTIIGPDDEVHVALNACDLCFDAKKGYVQSGSVMRCNNCGLTFEINSIGTDNTEGGCWPSYIPINIDGDNVIIDKSDLDAKKFMFE